MSHAYNMKGQIPPCPSMTSTKTQVTYIWSYIIPTRTAVAQWLRCCATNRKVVCSIPAGVLDIKSFQPHYGPGVDSGVAQWLRWCATNRKVIGSIPDGVTGIFIDIKSFRSH